MKLAEKKFSKTLTVVGDKNKFRHTVDIFTYETGNRLYDIMMFDNGMKFYRVDMGKWSNLITDIQPVHYRIENHFNI